MILKMGVRDVNWHLGQAAAYYQAAHALYRPTVQPVQPELVEPSVWDKISVALLTFIIACGLIDLLAHVK